MKSFGWLFFIFFLCIPLAYWVTRPKPKPLPIINPVDIQENTVDPELLRLGRGHRIGSFRFLNQDSVWVTDKDFDQKIWVVEYFFTTCGSICPIMNEQMQRVQRHFVYDSTLQLLSFTVHPQYDTPKVLNQYARDHGALPARWQFLTGSQKELYRVARRYFFLLKPSEVANAGDVGSDFIHTNNFVLVDKKRRIRGYYDGTDAKEVQQLLKDIETLKLEL